MTSKVTKLVSSLTLTIRRACAFYAMRFAVWADTEITVKLALALAREHIHMQMSLHGIDSFHPDYDAEGNEVIRVTRRDQTVH